MDNNCFARGISSRQELDNRGTDLVRELLVATFSALCIPGMNLDSLNCYFWNELHSIFPFRPGMEHVSRYPLNQDRNLDFLKLSFSF